MRSKRSFAEIQNSEDFFVTYGTILELLKEQSPLLNID